MRHIVSIWCDIATRLQGVALIVLVGALIVCALRLHYLTHRTAPVADADPVEGTLRAGRR